MVPQGRNTHQNDPLVKGKKTHSTIWAKLVANYELRAENPIRNAFWAPETTPIGNTLA